jgi:hypothetical protein
MNDIVEIRTIDDLLEYWVFLKQGMVALNDPRGAKATYTDDTFLQLLLKVFGMDEAGLIVVLQSKNGKPLAFGICFEAVDIMEERCFFVWAAYTNGKYKGGLQELCKYAETYARKRGIRCLKAATKRICGANIRLFERGWKFRREFMTFRKDI